MKNQCASTGVISKLIFIGLITFPIIVSGQHKKDSLQGSVSFSVSFGMMRDQGQDAISFLSSYNPTYNLRYGRMELGLGIDFYRYTFRLSDRYSIDNIYSFSSSLKCFLFKKQYIYAELFLNTGYWESKGELEIYEGNRYISTYGPGIGILLPPLPRFRDTKLLKNIYGIINHRVSLAHRDILILRSDTNIGLVYKF